MEITMEKPHGKNHGKKPMEKTLLDFIMSWAFSAFGHASRAMYMPYGPAVFDENYHNEQIITIKIRN